MTAIFGRLNEYWELTVNAARAGGLSVPQQLLEMSALLLLRGIGPGYYHLAAFWRRGVPWRDKWAHLSGGEYVRSVNKLNPPHYQKFSQDKFVEKAILEHLAVPCMAFAGYATATGGRCNDGSWLRNGEDFERLVRSLGWSRLCIKDVEGWAGSGFTALEITTTDGVPQVRELDGTQVSAATQYWEEKIKPRLADGVLFEAFLEQHPGYARFNPSSVNTLRIWVRQTSAGAAVLLCYLRLGRGGSLVDNIGSGGVVVPVDLASGRLAIGLCGTPKRRTFATHPDHGAQIEGEILPDFELATRLACECLEIFPGLTFAGVDVAMSVNGPVMIELNAMPDRNGCAHLDVPGRFALN